MADYRDLLRRAIEALPENNGNARRQVYDKARKALRGQLDAITPSLASREKTFHRLQLEECIREVEQEATERVLAGLSLFEADTTGAEKEDDVVADVPHFLIETGAPEDHPLHDELAVAPAVDDDDDALVAPPDTSTPHKRDGRIAEANAVAAARVPVEQAADKMPAAVQVADALVADAAIADEDEVDDEDADTDGPDEADDPIAEVIRRAQATEPVRPPPAPPLVPFRPAPDPSARMHGVAGSSGWGGDLALKERPVETATAMSAVREVEVDVPHSRSREADPQVAIDHAIAMLDRAVEGKGDDAAAADDAEIQDPDGVDGNFARTEFEDDGGGRSALTIFLVLFVLLLAGAGGAGYWAWREGYVDFKTMFGAGPAEVTTEQVASAAQPKAKTVTTVGQGSNGPGNTAATPDAVKAPTSELVPAPAGTSSASSASSGTATTTVNASGSSANTAPTTNGPAVVADNTTATPAAAAANLAVAQPNSTETKVEDRLPVAADPTNALVAPGPDAPAPTADVVATGSQSLLLEASDQGTTGAVPYSGTVEWTRGVDELGQPTLEGKANIPARNMGVKVLIRRNADPSLPASHLIEIDFTVSDSFIGGGIARIAGVLLKNEELVQGVPLVGASARVVGNSFLFALSAAAQDVTANTALLRSRKWMDLALIYSTGKQAIITLEKDAAATKLFDDVMTTWDAEASAAKPKP